MGGVKCEKRSPSRPDPALALRPYTTAMPSVADDLRRALRERILAMSPKERIALTARLAESDPDIFCSAR
jgi:hypothetical protein